MSPEQATALLSQLETTHGPNVLHALLGAAFRADYEEAKNDADALVSFDLGWLCGFAWCDDFRKAAGGDALAALDDRTCSL